VFHGSLEILFDAFSIKDVPAFRLNGILRNVIADSANRGLTDLSVGEGCSISFTFEHKIGMTSHLPHAGESDEAY
jgi:hypothetical protein